MKHIILFLSLFLANNKLFGCSFYPYGEDVRFSIFKPSLSNNRNFNSFNYSSNTFFSNGNEYEIEFSKKLNLELWSKKYKGLVDINSIDSVLYGNHPINIKNISLNKFVGLLIKKNDREAIEYINFIKKCSPFNNSEIIDPWERDSYNVKLIRSELIKSAITFLTSIKDNDIRLRYAFQIIRLSYYNNDFEILNRTFELYFSNLREKNIIYYWSLYFYSQALPSSALSNYYSALVFSNAPDKQLMCFKKFNTNISINETLTFAKNNKEKALIWFIYGVNKHGKALEYIKKIYEIDPTFEGLEVLVNREINKLEDWILTPYYTQFDSFLSYLDSEEVTPTMSLRSKNDLQYTKSVIKFLNSINLKKVANPQIFGIATAYLAFMSKNFQLSLNELNFVENNYNLNTKDKNRLEIVKALIINSMQPQGSFVIVDKIKPIIRKEYLNKNYSFIFALARELEFGGNKVDAALLYSKVFEEGLSVFDSEYKSVVYRSQNTFSDYINYSTDYFSYLDLEYSAIDVEMIINYISSDTVKNSFDLWLSKNAKKDLQKLYDLCGTKYLRANNLPKALFNIKKINNNYWQSENYVSNLNSNPFYTNLVFEHEGSEADTITFTKKTLLQQLIKYLIKANNVNEKNRDYYYFLVANCYFNMTHHGNSWIMKHYQWSIYDPETSVKTDEEYFNCDLAKKYYLKAKRISKSRKFSALCLRMAGRCEKYKLKRTNINIDHDYIFSLNSYYKILKAEYPEYYENLISNCESFKEHFKARN